jgi:hypothetical protein
MKQKSYPRLGALLATFANTLGWLSIVNFTYNSIILWTVQQKAIIAIIPWMNIVLFIIIGVLLIALPIALMDYLLFAPSRQAYASSQELKHQSPYAANLKRLEKNQKKIMNTLGIKDE